MVSRIESKERAYPFFEIDIPVSDLFEFWEWLEGLSVNSG